MNSKHKEARGEEESHEYQPTQNGQDERTAETGLATLITCRRSEVGKSYYIETML